MTFGRTVNIKNSDNNTKTYDNDNTEAAVDDTTEEDYTAMTKVWKSKMRRKMDTKFQYTISAVDTSLNHPLSSSFSNAQ